MRSKDKPLRRLLPLVGMLVVLGAVLAAVAIGDQVRNATTANGIGGGSVHVDSGDSVAVPYWVEDTGQAGCVATSEEPLVVAINVPAGVTADKSSLTFTSCGGVTNNAGTAVYTNEQYVTFTVNSAPPAGGFTVPAVDVEDSNVQTNGTSFKFVANGDDGGGGTTTDSTPPTISYVAAPAANGFGWNNSNVTITWTVTDDVGIDAATVTGCGTATATAGEYAATISAEAVKNLDDTFTGAAPTCSAADTSGNLADTTVDPQILIDKTAPAVGVTGLASPAVYTTGALPTPGCSTSDALSGVQTPASVSTDSTGLNSNGVGNVGVACSGAADNADNPGSANSSYTVNYGFSGGSACVLQPINCDNTSVFSRGKSVPVKFRLNGDEGIDTNSDGISEGFATSGWRVIKSKQSCVISSNATNEEQAAMASNSAGLRYDAGADQYIYNADFRQDQVGTCWKMRVVLDDPAATTLTSAVFRLVK